MFNGRRVYIAGYTITCPVCGDKMVAVRGGYKCENCGFWAPGYQGPKHK